MLGTEQNNLTLHCSKQIAELAPHYPTQFGFLFSFTNVCGMTVDGD